MSGIEFRRAGDRAWLLDLPDDGSAPRVARALRGLPLEEVVPGHSTVLAVGTVPADELLAAAECALADRDDEPDVATVEIPVTYDGPDLDEVARLTGLGTDEIVARHAAGAYVVAFVGFAPGFGYLVGGDARLHVPRRAEPRERVPGGTVAIAGPYSGVYPRQSPGGWQLIGRTEATLFDVEREPPALLQPGDHVRFIAQ